MMSHVARWLGRSVSIWILSSTVVHAADLAAPASKAQQTIGTVPTLVGFALYTQYASDYNFRGISQSNRQGSLQTFFEVQLLDNFAYAGFYTWQTRLPTRPDFEFDLVAGIRPTFGDLSLDLGVIYYYYPGESRAINPVSGGILTTANSDFIEYAGRALYKLNDALSVGANVFHAPSFFGQHAIATYTSGTISYVLPSDWFLFLPTAYSGGFTLSMEGGHYFIGAAKTSATGFDPTLGRFAAVDLPSYNYGNVGVSWSHKNLTIDLRYHMTDLTPAQCFTSTGDFRGYLNGGRSNWCGDTLIGTIRWQASTAAPGIFAEPTGLRGLFH